MDVKDKAALVSTQEQLALGELLQWIFQRKCLCRLKPGLIAVPHIRADTPRRWMHLVAPQYDGPIRTREPSLCSREGRLKRRETEAGHQKQTNKVNISQKWLAFTFSPSLPQYIELAEPPYIRTVPTPRSEKRTCGIPDGRRKEVDGPAVQESCE